MQYIEDDLRKQLFRDHPFEAFRPRTLVEGMGIESPHSVSGKAWKRWCQRGRNLHLRRKSTFLFTSRAIIEFLRVQILWLFSVRSVPLCSCPIPWTSLRTPLSYGLCYTWRGNFWLHFCELGNSENVWEREGSARSVEARGAAGWESFNDEEEVEGNHREGYWRRKMDEGARSVITVRWIYNRNFGDYCFTQFHLGIWRCPGTTTLDSN